MLSGEGNAGERRKNNNRSNQQKSNFARAAHFFVHFFAVAVQKPFYGGNIVRVLVHFFLHCRSFSPCIGGR